LSSSPGPGRPGTNYQLTRLEVSVGDWPKYAVRRLSGNPGGLWPITRPRRYPAFCRNRPAPLPRKLATLATLNPCCRGTCKAYTPPCACLAFNLPSPSAMPARSAPAICHFTVRLHTPDHPAPVLHRCGNRRDYYRATCSRRTSPGFGIRLHAAEQAHATGQDKLNRLVLMDHHCVRSIDCLLTSSSWLILNALALPDGVGDRSWRHGQVRLETKLFR
jgi:hypothetical protein